MLAVYGHVFDIDTTTLVGYTDMDDGGRRTQGAWSLY